MGDSIYVVEIQHGKKHGWKLKAFYTLEDAQGYIFNWFVGFMEDLYVEDRFRAEEEWECDTLNDFQETYKVKFNFYKTCSEGEPLDYYELFWKAVDKYQEWKRRVETEKE
jgi:hypothetical protein